MKLLSIIIPAYQAENTIIRALNSIRQSKSKDIEVIIVNDGSLDRTAKRVLDASRLDHRFHLYSQSNSGRSSARNTGLSKAKGQYIIFLDSDDYFLPFALDKLISICSKTSLNFYVFPFIKSSSPNRIGYSEVSHKDIYLNSPISIDPSLYKDILKNPFVDYSSHFPPSFNLSFYDLNSCWAKIYRREFIFQLGEKPFPTGVRFSEDKIFNLKYLSTIPNGKIAFYNIPIYYWDLMESSTVSMFKLSDVSYFNIFCEALNNLADYGYSEKAIGNIASIEYYFMFINACKCSSLNNWLLFCSELRNQYLLNKYIIKSDTSLILNNNSLINKIVHESLSSVLIYFLYLVYMIHFRCHIH